MPPTSPAPFNIASLLSQAAAQDPQKTAVHCPQSPDCRGQASLTFAALDQDSSTVAAGLLSLGLDPGDRVAVALRPGIDFYVVIFALFKAGLIPVMVDPGVGARRALQCLAESRPQGLVGIPLAHAASLIFPGYFKNVRTRVTLGRTLGWGGSTVLKLLRKGAPLINPVPTLASDPAAILFTSGATGPPKGVLYTHAMFRAQVEAIRNNFPLPPGGVELVTFPLFGLFTPALSMTSVIADMNSAKPAQADPAKLVSSLSANKVTSLFASPALLRRLAPYCREKKIVLSGLKSVISAGAPAPPAWRWNSRRRSRPSAPF
jgi:acyl-CoA synthetase (AMP-forming)/AMP-acid ligase II